MKSFLLDLRSSLETGLSKIVIATFFIIWLSISHSTSISMIMPVESSLLDNWSTRESINEIFFIRLNYWVWFIPTWLFGTSLIFISVVNTRSVWKKKYVITFLKFSILIFMVFMMSVVGFESLLFTSGTLIVSILLFYSVPDIDGKLGFLQTRVSNLESMKVQAIKINGFLYFMVVILLLMIYSRFMYLEFYKIQAISFGDRGFWPFYSYASIYYGSIIISLCLSYKIRNPHYFSYEIANILADPEKIE